MAEYLPKVSVIIPIFRVEKYLEQCITSVRNQTLTDIEIILVDEGDDDECFEIMQIEARYDQRIIILHKKHGGYGASCNAALAIAKGEYIAILEADDYILPNFYMSLYVLIKENDADIIKSPYLERIDQQLHICNFADKLNAKIKSSVFGIETYPEILTYHASIWSCLYRNEFLRKNNIKFKENPGSGYVDNDFRINTLLKAKKIFWHDKAGYVYNLDNENSSTNKYDLMRMALNWLDIHETINMKFKKNKDVILPALMVDEYYSLFRPYLFYTANGNNDIDIIISKIIHNLKFRYIASMPVSKVKKIRIALTIYSFKNRILKIFIRRLEEFVDMIKISKEAL